MAENITDLQQLLTEEAQFIDGELRKMLAIKKIGITEDLLHSLRYQVYADNARLTGKYQLSFKTYGRMVDMGAGRIRIHDVDGASRKFRKPKKWYSRTVYGIIFGRVLDRLMSMTQDATISSIKEPLLQS